MKKKHTYAHIDIDVFLLTSFLCVALPFINIASL